VVFTSSPPASIQAGTTFSATATTEDPSSNVVNDFAGNVTVALTVPGSATLSGTLTQPVVNGVANFGDLSVNKTGSYSLTATSSPALTSAISSSFAIQPGPATQLVFTVQPPATPTAGATLAPAIQVSIEDSLNNVVTGDSVTQVTVALTTPNGATLGGTTTQTALSGVASFTNLNVDKTGSYTLTATSTPSLTSAVSTSVVIQPGAAAQLAFVQQPTTAQSTVAIAPAVTVAIEDSLGNVVTSDTSTITVSLASNVPGGTLSGTLSQPASAGVATFGNLAIDKVGSYTLGASGGGFTAPASNSFSIT
jgi:hypothetical protein